MCQEMQFEQEDKMDVIAEFNTSKDDRICYMYPTPTLVSWSVCLFLGIAIVGHHVVIIGHLDVLIVGTVAEWGRGRNGRGGDTDSSGGG